MTEEQGAAVLLIITAMASSYTRGEGFTHGVPAEAIRAVILTASARLIANARGLLLTESVGPEHIEFRSAFNGWTTGELLVLNRYRVRAK